MSNSSAPLDFAQLQQGLVARAGVLHAYIQKRIPQRYQSALAPEDVLQEVWVSAHKRRSAFRPRGPNALEKWLWSIADSRLIDALRACRAAKRGGDRRFVQRPGFRSSSLTDLFDRVRSPEATPSRTLSAKEAVHAVQIALASLPDARREAIRLHYLDGMSAKEIAGRMDRSKAAINSLLCHGLRQLRSRLGQAEKFFSDHPR
jgi:RNA polymerase sigma-70 factor (ECF subfamily)